MCAFGKSEKFKGLIVKMADAEVLLNNVANLGTGFIAFNFSFNEFGSGRIFAHDTVSDFVKSKEIPVGSYSPGRIF